MTGVSQTPTELQRSLYTTHFGMFTALWRASKPRFNKQPFGADGLLL